MADKSAQPTKEFTMKTIALMLLAVSLYAQKQGLPIPEFGRVAQQLNNAPFVQVGNGSPTAVACVYPGIDQYFDQVGNQSYICIVASQTAGTWELIGAGSGG